MFKHIYIPVIILFLSTLVACKTSREIAIPEAPLPDTFRHAIAKEAESIAEIKWKTFFNDPGLQRLIDSAIVNNYDMQLAIKNIEGARLLLNQTKWAYWPDAAVQITATSNRPSDNSLNGLSTKTFLGATHVEDYSANLTLSWEADIWGKIKNRRSGALATYLQTEEARKWVQTNIVANVAEGFYNLLMLEAQLAIAKRNLTLSDSTLQIIKLQFNAGQVTALAIEQVTAQQLTAAALVPQLEKNITIQENALRILTGALPDRIQRNTLLNQVTITENLSAGIPSTLLNRRPDVKSNELGLIRANAQVGITKADMYPSLRITAGTGLNAFKATNWFNIPASLFGIVAGSIVQPVLQKKQLKTAFEVAKGEREKAVIQFRQSVLNAVGEVSNALVRIDKIKEEQQIALNRVQTLQKAVANANLLFTTGMANYLEVITAQSNALQSELMLAALTREQLSAKIELYRSLGGGWK
jgi:multidrug efflux system outer membrane protein